MASRGIRVVKAHAYGNDFLLVEESEIGAGADRPALARAMCERRRGIGADGLIVYQPTAGGAAMRLLNADGSRSEVSGNGVRCLAAWLVEQGRQRERVEIETDAGPKRLDVLERDAGRITFRASMGRPEQVTRVPISVAGSIVEAVTLRVGNPQCVVLGEVSAERLHTLGAALAVHPHFPEGTNVELATVAAPDCVRILIWERGVGPTEASGTGACAAAVAAVAYGGAARDVRVESPGGVQRVEWTDEGLFLTGWAALTLDGRWLDAGTPG